MSEPIKKDLLKEIESQKSNLNRLKKQNQKLLRKSQSLQDLENKYQIINENIPVVVYSALPDKFSTCVFISGNVESLTGYKDEEFIKDPELWNEIIHPDDKTRVWENIKKHRKKKIPLDVQYRIITKQGKLKWLRDYATPIIDKKGTYVRNDGYMEDITPQKLNEIYYKESEEKLKSFLKSSTIGIWCFKPEQPVDTSLPIEKQIDEFFMSRCIECNETYAKMMGTDRDSIIGIRLSEVQPDNEENREFLRAFIQNDYKISGGISHEITKDGQHKYFSNSFIATVDEGMLIHAWGTQTDITEQKKSEDALRESEKKYRLLIENANESIFVAQDNKLKFTNPKTEEITGFTRKELLSCSVENFLHKEDKNSVLKRFEKLIEKQRDPGIYQFRILNKNGRTKWVEVRSVLIDWEGRPATLNFMTDITPRKRNEERIKSSLKEKEVLLGEIHHRVKNNLQVIMSLIKLQAKNIDDIKAQEAFENTRNRIYSMALIHDKFYRSKDFSKIQFKEYAESMIKETLHLMEVSSHISFNMDINNVPLDIKKAIPCGLLLNEMISNSLKHAFPADRKGTVTVTFKPVKDKVYELIVRDNGVGFDIDQIESRDTFGLKLIKIITEQLGGDLTIKSDRGASFSIRFELD